MNRFKKGQKCYVINQEYGYGDLVTIKNRQEINYQNIFYTVEESDIEYSQEMLELALVKSTTIQENKLDIIIELLKQIIKE